MSPVTSLSKPSSLPIPKPNSPIQKSSTKHRQISNPERFIYSCPVEKTIGEEVEEFHQLLFTNGRASLALFKKNFPLLKEELDKLNQDQSLIISQKNCFPMTTSICGVGNSFEVHLKLPPPYRSNKVGLKALKLVRENVTHLASKISSLHNEHAVIQKLNEGAKTHWGLIFPIKSVKTYYQLQADPLQRSSEIQIKIRRGCSSFLYDTDYFEWITKNENIALETYLLHFHQLASALKELSCQDIIHRDIKLENILCKEHEGFLFVHLADFEGATASIDQLQKKRSEQSVMHTSLYTIYRELMLSEDFANSHDLDQLLKLEKSMDSFALGIVFYLALCRKWPYPFSKIGNKKYTSIPLNCEIERPSTNPVLNLLILGMLAPNWQLRKNAKEVLQELDVIIETDYPHLLEEIEKGKRMQAGLFLQKKS